MRLIDADAIKYTTLSYGGWGGPPEEIAHKYNIDKMPTVDAVPVVHGAWEPRKDVFGFVRCSVCHDCNIYDDWADGKKWAFCPQCGAKMDLEVKDA